MTQRTYQQHCGLARALDVVGERWTLLVLRELVGGPRRYKHLLAGLPGIGTGMLASRLKALEQEGIVRHRRLPPPADAAVYELTDLGRELESALVGLTRFGQHWMHERRAEDAFRPSWLALAMRASIDPEATRGMREAYELRAEDGVVLTVRVDDGHVEVSDGPADDAVVSLRASSETLLGLVAGHVDARAALAEGTLQVDGDRRALGRWGRVLRPAPAARAGAHG